MQKNNDNGIETGKLVKYDNYQTYIPNKISDKNFIFNDNRIYKLLEDAATSLGKLNELSYNVEFANMFTDMHVHFEALESSEIEGTHADLYDVIDKSSIGKDNRDAQVIKNLYETTHNFHKSKDKNLLAIENLKKMNMALFNKITPQEKYAGKIRSFQNYVGGNSILDALYIPPPPEIVEELLIDLNNFWNDENFYIPNLIKIAICHFQFETIHPFVDGNGRMGRLLINLQLKNCKMLELPILCLSNYWKKNKGLYYDALSNARFSNNMEHWIRFFLSSIYSASNERIDTINKINKIAYGYADKIKERVKNPVNSMRILEFLLKESPYINVKTAQEEFGLTYQGANKIIDNFVNMGILKEVSNNKRNRIFLFEEYFKLMFSMIEKNN